MCGFLLLYREPIALFSKAVGRGAERREIARESSGSESPGTFSNNDMSALHWCVDTHACTYMYTHNN